MSHRASDFENSGSDHQAAVGHWQAWGDSDRDARQQPQAANEGPAVDFLAMDCLVGFGMPLVR